VERDKNLIKKYFIKKAINKEKNLREEKTKM
jgi:hypothetical protein